MPTRLRPWGVWRWGRCRGWGWGWGFSLIAGGVFFSGLWCFLALALLDQAVVAIVLIVYSWLFAVGGGRVSARRPTHFSLLRQRKVSQRKATHSLRPLRVATGQTCVGVFAGCAVELALRCARRSDNHGESVDEACALRRACHPATTPPQAQPDGAGQPKHPNSPTGLRCARPGLRSARRLRPRTRGRAKRWPVWMSGCGFPSGCAEERSGQRIRARDCLSEASSSETPLDASTGGCPQRSEGTQPVGSLFLGLLSFGEAKESESPAGAKSRPPPRTQA